MQRNATYEILDDALAKCERILKLTLYQLGFRDIISPEEKKPYRDERRAEIKQDVAKLDDQIWDFLNNDNEDNDTLRKKIYDLALIGLEFEKEEKISEVKYVFDSSGQVFVTDSQNGTVIQTLKRGEVYQYEKERVANIMKLFNSNDLWDNLYCKELHLPEEKELRLQIYLFAMIGLEEKKHLSSRHCDT